MDKSLRHQLLRAVCVDRSFLKDNWHLVTPELFSEREEAVIVEAAVGFYSRYEEPIGALLRSEVDEITDGKKFSAESKQKLKALMDTIQSGKMDLVSVKALSDRVWKLKRTRFYEEALSEAIEAHDKGSLTADFFSELVEKADKSLRHHKLVVHDYFDEEELEKRIRQRADFESQKLPGLLIDELDAKIQVLGRGQLGMVMAPPGGGKGLALVHFDIAYALQGYNVWHITLEDPLSLVESRLDAAITGLPLRRLGQLPNKLRKRFKRQRQWFRGRIKITDGTDGGYTITRIEREYEELCKDGFVPDVIIIDYDDEIECEKSYKGESARRFEFAEIYRRMRRLAKKTNTIVWTAAQPGKQAEGKKLIKSSDVAEDYSKIRKVFFCMTIGTVPDHPTVKYLYIPKNRQDKAHFGVEIVSNYDSAIFYDREESLVWQRTQAARESLR